MGRYTVPQYDHDDDDNNDDDPMEWEDLVADNSDYNGNGNHHRDNSNGNLNDIGSQLQDMSMNNGNHHHHSGHNNNLVCNESKAEIDRRNDYGGNGHPEDGASTHGPSSHSQQAMLQLMAEQYMNMNQSNQYMIDQQQVSLAKSRQSRRRRMQSFAIILVAIISIVLKRYAPPPPPLVLNHHDSSTLKEVFSSFSVDKLYRNNDLEDDNSNANSKEEVMIQHETWADYSTHVLHLVHHATLYGMSVGWYTVSNSFKYAIDEARDLFVSRDTIDTNVGNIGIGGLKDALISCCNTVKKAVSMVSLQYTTTTAADDNNHPQSNSDDSARQKQQPSSNSDNIMLPASDDKALATCPIHIPAAKNHKIPWFTTEDFLRQTIGSSLSPQNLALKVIAKSMDAWGRTSGEGVGGDGSAAAAAANVLPPAIGFLLVGSTGVGKLHTARRMAHLLLGHCVSYNDDDDDAIIDNEELDGVLEVIAREDDAKQHQQHSVKDQIVNHLLRRKGLGSVIILHHIEGILPTEILLELSQVLSGNSGTLSYFTQSSQGDNALVKKEVSCNGTVFILTSKQWGSESILQHIRSNDGLINGLNREALVSSIQGEVDSHFLEDGGGMKKFASHLTIAPFLPFQQDDIAAILQRRIQALGKKYQTLDMWKRLDVSYATIKHSAGVDHTKYLDLYTTTHHDGFEEEDDEGVNRLHSYAARGAHALDTNTLWKALKSRARGIEQRPDRVLNVRYIETYSDDLASLSKDLGFFWCIVGKVGLKDCNKEEGE